MNVPQTCSHAEEGEKVTSGGNTGKHPLTRAQSSGAVGCGGRLSRGNKRQQKEAEEVFAALTLDGIEASVLTSAFERMRSALLGTVRFGS